MTVAPWPDFVGQPINHGDRLMHPDGTTFVAVRLNGHAREEDAWRAVYDAEPTGSVSRLGLQIGDRGRAAVVPDPNRCAHRWVPRRVEAGEMCIKCGATREKATDP
jgi:hypothetical protein